MPLVAVTVTPLSAPSWGEVTVPAMVPVGAGPLFCRSAATIRRAVNWPTVGSRSKPTLLAKVVEPGKIGPANSSHRKQSESLAPEQDTSLKKLCGAPFQSVLGATRP